jgi:hexosaminidase
MWGEQVNSVNYDSRVWPRACAVAERLWSPQGVTNVAAAQTRLIEHACRLEQRGVRSGPIQPDYCVLPTDVTAYQRRLARRKKMRL